MRKRLGEILVQAGVIDELQLRSALAEAARWGKRVGEVLVSRGHCTDAQILNALASQLGVAVAPLAQTTVIPPRVLRLLPPAFARDKQVLPLNLDPRTGALEVAVNDPAGYELLDELRFRTGHEVRPLVAMPADLADAINHFYFGAPRGQASPRPAPAPQPAPIDLPPVGDAALDLFEHGMETGDFMGKARKTGALPPASDPPTPSRPPITVTVRRTPGESLESPSQSLSPGASQSMSPSASQSLSPGASPNSEALRRQAAPTPMVSEPAANELARLQMEVAELQGRLDKAYGILREAAIAHRALLAELAERGVIDKVSLQRRVRSQAANPGHSTEGER